MHGRSPKRSAKMQKVYKSRTPVKRPSKEVEGDAGENISQESQTQNTILVT